MLSETEIRDELNRLNSMGSLRFSGSLDSDVGLGLLGIMAGSPSEAEISDEINRLNGMGSLRFSGSLDSDVGLALQSLAGGADFDVVTASLFYDEFQVVTGNALTSFIREQSYNYVAYQDLPALGDETFAQFNLSAGDYTLFALGISSTNRGILTVVLDGIVQGTIDWYSAIQAANVVETLPITVLDDGTHSLLFRTVSKNASSTDYYMPLTKLWIR